MAWQPTAGYIPIVIKKIPCKIEFQFYISTIIQRKQRLYSTNGSIAHHKK